MPELTEAQLKQKIKEDQLTGLFFLYGPEKYLVHRAAKKLIGAAAGDTLPEFNRNEFGAAAPVDKIADAAEALPLMAARKCVAVSDFNIEEKNAGEQKKLLELLENVPDTTALILYYPTLEFSPKKAAKWKKLWKLVAEKGCAVEFKQREAAALRDILMKDAQRNGCALSRQNAAVIVEYAGPGLQALLRENAKLCAYANGAEITREMIEELVPKNLDATAFLLSDALVSGNIDRAYRLLDQLFYQRVEPLMILGALSATYIDLYRVRAALQSGESARAVAAYGEYRGREFRLTKAERNVRSLPLEALRGCMAALLEADIALKSAKAEPRVLMDRLLMRLYLAAKGEKSA